MLFRVQKVWIPDGYVDWSSTVEVEWSMCYFAWSRDDLEKRIVRENGPLEEWDDHRRAKSVITIEEVVFQPSHVLRSLVMDLIKKVKDLVAALKANDWATSISLTLVIITMITQGWNAPQQMKASSAKFASASDSTLEELTKELDDCCPQDNQAHGADLHNGPVIDTLMPILLAILRKLIGF